MRALAVSLALLGSAGCRPSETTWVIHPDQAGPVRFGMQASAALRALGDSSTRISLTGCTYWRPSAAPAGVSFMIEDGIVVRADVDSGAARVVTPEEIGIGSTEAAIRSAYGEHVTMQLHKYQWEVGWRYFIYLPPTDSLHGVVFETDGNRVRTFRAGRRPQVQYVERCG